MEMNWSWISTQLADTTSQRVNEAVVDLLHTLSISQIVLTDDELREALIKLQKLTLGHALITDAPDERWGPVEPGYYRIGDTVRVKADAYSGERGTVHNGRRGRVTAAHGPTCAVLYAGEKNSEAQYQHKLEALERLVP